MSVATQHSPFAVGNKRLYDSEENEDHLQRLESSLGPHKRYRQRGSPVRCTGGPRHACSVGQAALAALRGLFPDMGDKIIADVLAEFGDNIDAAIKHLTQLRLTSAGSVASAAPEQASTQSGPHPQSQQQPGNAQAPQQEQAQQQHEQHQASQHQRSDLGADPAGGQPSAHSDSSLQPKSAAEWVELMVQEMSAATDLSDARARAARMLQAFERAAVQHAQQQSAAQGAERLRPQLQDALRENQLLKRAVAIQNTRIQELSGKEAELSQLREVVLGLHQKVHALELQNYSLAMHLKQAADGKDVMHAATKNPDVF